MGPVHADLYYTPMGNGNLDGVPQRIEEVSENFAVPALSTH